MANIARKGENTYNSPTYNEGSLTIERKPMTWPKRMNAALEYIEAHLDGACSIHDVANAARCSKYHFHRVFFANFGVTLAEYIRGRKLTLAAIEVQNSESNILDIALKYGYESPNAFTRAFRDFHGVNPSKARTRSIKLSSQNQVNFPTIRGGVEKMDYTILQKPAFNITGHSEHFKFENFIKNGHKYWKEYTDSEKYQELYRLNNGLPGSITQSSIISAYFPSENGNRDEFKDVLGVETQAEINPQEFETHRVSPATYAEFICTYKTSLKTNRYIYGDWFSSTGYERAENLPDIVSYFPIPFRPLNEMLTRWWIPIIDTER